MRTLVIDGGAAGRFVEVPDGRLTYSVARVQVQAGPDPHTTDIVGDDYTVQRVALGADYRDHCPYCGADLGYWWNFRVHAYRVLTQRRLGDTSPIPDWVAGALAREVPVEARVRKYCPECPNYRVLDQWTDPK